MEFHHYTNGLDNILKIIKLNKGTTDESSSAPAVAFCSKTFAIWFPLAVFFPFHHPASPPSANTLLPRFSHDVMANWKKFLYLSPSTLGSVTSCPCSALAVPLTLAGSLTSAYPLVPLNGRTGPSGMCDIMGLDCGSMKSSIRPASLDRITET